MSKPGGLDSLMRWLQKARQYSDVRASSSAGLFGDAGVVSKPRNVLVVVGTHLDAVSREGRDGREREVREKVESLALGWYLEAVKEVALGSGLDLSTVAEVREAIICGASKLECMGEFVGSSVG